MVEVRKNSRATLVAAATFVAVSLSGVAYWEVTRPGSEPTTVLVAREIDAGIVIDSSFDAAIDAPIDALTIDAPPPTDWTMVTIISPIGTGLIGADGTDIRTIHGRRVVITAAEGAGAIGVATREGVTSGSIAVRSLSTVVNVEDARFCDVDSDGELDIIAGGQGKRIRVWLGVPPGIHTYSAEADDDIITATGHGWTTGDVVQVSNVGGGPPSGLSPATNFYVIRLTANTFKLATTFANALAGTAIDLTTDGFGTHTVAAGQTFTASYEIDAATNLQQWLQLACTTAGGVRIYATGRGTTPKGIASEADDDTLTSTAHGFTTGDTTTLSVNIGYSLPTGLETLTIYYTIRTGANTFKLATSRANALAGTAIDFTTDGSGTQTATRQAMLGYLAPVTPRSSSGWTWTPIHPVMWGMSVIPVDIDSNGTIDGAVHSDRQNGGGGITVGNKGTRFFREGEGDAWTREMIYLSNNEGDVKFCEVASLDDDEWAVTVGMSSGSTPNKLVRCTTSDWTSWSCSTITPYPDDVGQYQGVTTRTIDGELCDLDGDGIAEYVLTHSEAQSDAGPPHSDASELDVDGLVALNPATGSTIRIDLGVTVKLDDPDCLDWDGDGDLDIVSSGQHRAVDLNGNGTIDTNERDAGHGAIAFINPRLHL